jgi:hypothetical protein
VHQADWNDAECHVCGNVNPEQIFSIIDGKVVDEFGSLTNTRKIPAREWSEYFFKYIPQQSPNIYEYRDELKVSYSPPNWWQQFKIFIARDFRSKYANKGAQILNIMLAPILAVILTYIIKTYNVGEDVAYVFERNTNFPVYLFMAVIVAIFMGLTGSAQEIIKDRKILKREKFLSLSWSSYLLSKLGILLGIAALQSFLFVLFGNWIIELPGMFFPYWAVLFSVWASGIIMGLIVSDSVEREVTIYILIPFLIIPQIILSGIIIKFDKLNPDISTPDQIPWYGEIMTARWGYEALAVHQFIYNDFNKPIYKWERQMSNAQYITDNWFTEINRRLDFLKQNAGKTKWEKENLQYIALLKTEIPKMMTADNGYLHIDLNNLSIKAQNLQSDLKKLSADLWVLKNDFNNRYLEAEKEEQEYVNKIIGIHGRDYYRYLKEHNQNEKMQQMLKNRDFSKDNRIVEYEGRLIRKYEPVFQDPMFKTLRAHFFAPRKRLGNFYIETLWANVLIMWLMFGGMYVVLYTQWLKKLLAYISRVKFFQFFFKRVI